MDEDKTMATKTIAPDDEVAILDFEIPDELLESTGSKRRNVCFYAWIVHRFVHLPRLTIISSQRPRPRSGAVCA